MPMSNEELAKLAGEEHYLRAPRMNYPTIRMNGKVGKFFRNVAPTEKDGKYTKEDLGVLFRGVILRVRRRLVDFSGGYQTNEHDSSKQNVILFQKGKKVDSGDYVHMREKYQKLKTEQVLYVLVGKDVFKLIVAGSSLMRGDSKPAESIPFYEYLGSFDKAKDEHVFQYYTDFTPVEETGKLGAYYSVSFVRGDKLSDAEMDIVAEKLKVLATQIQSNDTSVHEDKKESVEQPDAEDELPTIQVEDGITVEDIPF